MVSDPFFGNAFVADGIVPDHYGLRTVMEYRTRLYSVPHKSPMSNHIPSPDDMDIISPGNAQQQQPSPPHPLSSPQSPDPEEGEAALRHLAKMLDLSSIGPLNPLYYAVLRVVPPPYLRNSAHADSLDQHRLANPPPWPRLVLSSLLSAMLGGPPRRNAELHLMSWHWADYLLAVASGADLDRIAVYHFSRAEWEIPGDRHHSLYAIRAIEFRPFAGRVLAIACQQGVALLEGQNLRTLSHRNHMDVVSMSWSPDGQFLASASAVDGTVRMWDVATSLSLHVCSGSFVLFCPNIETKLLFVADAAAVNFRIWCCRSWACERWGSLSGPVVAATWSPDGSALFFSTHGQSAIHVLSIGNRDTGRETTISHIEVTNLPREGPGGPPIQLEIDPSGERLAVVYEVPEHEGESDDKQSYTSEDPHRRYVVALYAVQLRPSFSMMPVGYVSGPMGSGAPLAIKFKPRPGGSTGALLSTLWRNGEISFTHLFFNAMQE